MDKIDYVGYNVMNFDLRGLYVLHEYDDVMTTYKNQLEVEQIQNALDSLELDDDERD